MHQANQSSKKIAAQNIKILQYHLYAIIITTILYIITRFMVFSKSFTYKHIVGFLLIESLLVALYLQLAALARDDGMDLSDTNSLIAYYFDIMYIGIFVLVTKALVADVFWYTLWLASIVASDNGSLLHFFNPLMT